MSRADKAAAIAELDRRIHERYLRVGPSPSRLGA